jgi:hypothetical protein
MHFSDAYSCPLSFLLFPVPVPVLVVVVVVVEAAGKYEGGFESSHGVDFASQDLYHGIKAGEIPAVIVPEKRDEGKKRNDTMVDTGDYWLCWFE